MAETTNISWADATLNFWAGCTKVSEACRNCYAETWANRFPRYRGTWGVGAPRVKMLHCLTKARKLEKLALAKAARGEGAFFCFSNSLSDIFDKEVPIEWLVEAFEVAEATPAVTYLFLTKRPQQIVKRWLKVLRHRHPDEAHLTDPEIAAAHPFPANVALGCTVVNQQEADRDLPRLRGAKVDLRPAFIFVSMEPLLEVVDISKHMWPVHARWPGGYGSPEAALADGAEVTYHRQGLVSAYAGFLDWVITGGESGTHARPCDPDAYRSLRDQCARAEVPFEFKQWGEFQPTVGTPVAAVNQKNIVSYGVDPGRRVVMRLGSDNDPCTLDGVAHHQRPVPHRVAA